MCLDTEGSHHFPHCPAVKKLWKKLFKYAGWVWILQEIVDIMVIADHGFGGRTRSMVLQCVVSLTFSRVISVERNASILKDKWRLLVFVGSWLISLFPHGCQCP